MKIFYIVLIFPFLSFAQIPNGYYTNVDSLEGEELRTALYNIIDNHNVESYNDLWTDFKSTDKKTNGKVWDMYSIKADGTATYEYTFGSDQCGNYGVEGDCYNREHSFPKSWFNNDYPMYTDLFHLYPTDGYVNGRRSNYPYGEVSSPTWTSTNGSKVGHCSYPGYSGTVFEPIDEFKGDFARSYFYMITRYKDEVISWSSDMLEGDGFKDWALNMLIEWHNQDPVSQKETDRNNAVYNIQNNRNPFIDHPEYVCLIWSSNCSSSIQAKNIDVKISLYPNPAKKNCTIESSNIKITKIVVYNISGKEILSKNYSNNFDVSNFEKGIYFIKIITQNATVVKKLRVQ